MNILDYVEEMMQNGYTEEEALVFYGLEYGDDDVEYDRGEDFRYSVIYDEPLYVGDSNYNGHDDLWGYDTDNWEEVSNTLNAYGKDVRITVRDNYYGVSYDSFDEEWN